MRRFYEFAGNLKLIMGPSTVCTACCTRHADWIP